MNALNQFVLRLLLLYVVWTNVHAIPLQHRKLLQPTFDIFYTPPSGYEIENPGTILKYRTLSHNSFSALSAFPQNLKSTYQILYRTTDGLGNPVATVTTLLVPYGADPTKLVSYEIAQDSSSENCAPSYTLQAGSKSLDLIPQIEPLLVDSLFRRGWYVSIPDYEGPEALFGVGRMAGKATLDGIRAVLSSSNITKIDPLADIQMWGYSGGSIPVGWAAQLHPSYAPELNIIGAAMGGTLVSPNATINSLRNTFGQSLVLLYFRGLANQYKDMADYMKSIIKPEKKKEYDGVSAVCVTELMVKYGFGNLDTFVTRPDYADDPIMKRIFEENIMGQIDVPTIPLYMYHAEYDKMTPFSEVKTLYMKWCNNGANIQLVSDAITTHSWHLLTGTPAALTYLDDRFGQKPLQNGCSTRSAGLSLFKDRSFDSLVSFIWSAISGLRGTPLGLGKKKTPRHDG